MNQGVIQVCLGILPPQPTCPGAGFFRLGCYKCGSFELGFDAFGACFELVLGISGFLQASAVSPSLLSMEVSSDAGTIYSVNFRAVGACCVVHDTDDGNGSRVRVLLDTWRGRRERQRCVEHPQKGDCEVQQGWQDTSRLLRYPTTWSAPRQLGEDQLWRYDRMGAFALHKVDPVTTAFAR